MPDERDELLDQLAKLIADGSDIEWPESSDDEEPGLEEETLDDLKALARWAEFNRGASRQLVAEVSLEIKQWGPLRLEEKVGGGSFGEVYLAVDSKLEREVALKLLRLDRDDARGRKRALREGRMLAKINHPNVAKVYGADEHGGRVGVWMEFVRGLTLDQMVQLQGTFSAREAASIGVEVCRGLAAVHSAGLVHCDIKAQNIMRRSGGRILLVDFGLGAEADHQESGEHRLRGTPLYLPPERLSGHRATHRGDIYALGVLLYFLVTETFPVIASDLEDLRQQHQASGARLLSDARSSLPGWFIDVVQTALSPNPDQRFATAGEMERALVAGLAPVALKPATAPPKRRRLISWAAAMALAAALALAYWFYLAQAPTENLKPAGIVLAELKNYVEDAELLQISHLLSDGLRQGVPLFELADRLDLEGARAKVGLGSDETLDAQTGLRVGRALYEIPVVIEPAVWKLGGGYRLRVLVKTLLESNAPLQNEWIENFQISAKDRLTAEMDSITEWIRGTALRQIRARGHYAAAMRIRGDEPAEALYSLTQALEEVPDFALALVGKGSILVGLQRFGEGYQDLQKADQLLRTGQRDAESLFATCVLADNVEDYKGNEACALELAKQDPRPQHFFPLGIAQSATGHFEEAQASFSKALKSENPAYQHAARVWLVRMQIVLNRLADAEETISLLDADDRWKEALLGTLAFWRQDYEGADSAFQRMRREDADSREVSDGYAAQALIQAERGLLTAALHTLNEGIKYDTQVMPGLEERYQRALQGNKAQKRLMRAALNAKKLEFEPGNDELRHSITDDCQEATLSREPLMLARAGIILARAGLIEEAEKYQRLANQQSADIPVSRRSRLKLSGEILIAQGEPEKGLEQLKMAAEDDPAFYPREYLARAYSEAGELGNAAQEYQKILHQPGIFWILPVHERWPGLYADTLLEWCRLAPQVGDAQESKKYLERYLKLRGNAEPSFQAQLEKVKDLWQELQ